jgi:hypothetical protein
MPWFRANRGFEPRRLHHLRLLRNEIQCELNQILANACGITSAKGALVFRTNTPDSSLSGAHSHNTLSPGYQDFPCCPLPVPVQRTGREKTKRDECRWNYIVNPKVAGSSPAGPAIARNGVWVRSSVAERRKNVSSYVQTCRRVRALVVTTL